MMYKVTVNSSGKYYNVILGARYCLTRKSTIKLANLYLNFECDITIEKLIRMPSAFVWSDVWEETKIVFDEDDEGNLIARKAKKRRFLRREGASPRVQVLKIFSTFFKKILDKLRKM